jgi:1,4-alpha-glucan branching enzyme
MRSTENPAQVGIRGNFTDNSWNETLLMTDQDRDGIYELTIERTTAANDIEFKFVNQYDEFELQGQDNRSIEFEYKPETIVYEAVFNKPNGKQTSIK